MAKAVAARQFGDEYQQLVFWKYALGIRFESSREVYKSVFSANTGTE